jgi:hypothetical protein
MVTGALASLTPAGSANALDTKTGPDEYRVDCPAVWAGPDGKTESWSYGQEWIEESELVGAPNFDVSRAKSGGVSIDCAYGEEGHRSPYRLTVVVPGKVRGCFSNKSTPKAKVYDGFSCLTKADYSGAIGPVMVYVAEQVSIQTRLSGFALRRSKQEVLRTAAVAGWVVRQQNESELALIRQGQEIRISFGADELSREVTVPMPDVPEQHEVMYSEVVRRFGLWRGWPSGKDIWASRIDPRVSVEIHTDSRGLASSVHLIDGAKGDRPR